MNEFKEQITIITGGANGIGKALAQTLGRAGAHVVIGDINDELGSLLSSEIRASGGSARYQHTDVRVAQSVSELVEKTVSLEGRVDYMFNNAGIAVAGDSRDLNLDHWRKVTDVNYWGVVYGSKFAFDAMAKQGHGHIVNIASLAGLIPFPTNLPYSATKHAVVGMSMSLRAEGADLGVNVSVVCPGFIDSNIFQASDMVNIPRIDLVKSIPFKLVETNTAADKILTDVTHNKAIIVFPMYAKVFWWLYRLKHSLINIFALKTIRDMRKIRDQVSSN